MKVEKSPEIEAVISRWIRAQTTHDGSILVNFFSSSEHLRYIGSDVDEIWSGELLRKGYADHNTEIPVWSLECFEKEAFECGEVGWATWIGEARFAGLAEPCPFRFSWVLLLEGGVWKIIQTHVSAARSNLEVMGAEHYAFDALIKAAEAEDGHFGDEGTITIMFTDIANSTSIANAVGDRDWALMIGRHLGMQTEAIAQDGGTLVKTLGDGTMSTIPAVGGAIRAAIAIQNSTTALVDEPGLEVRIGIHAGDVIQSKGVFSVRS